MTPETNPMVIILAGISGSGKTTLSKQLCAASQTPFAVVSADDYMTDAEGNWCFDPTRLSTVHSRCQSAFHEALDAKIPLVIVDNTNLQDAHREPYIDRALQCGYTVRLIVLDTDIDTASKRNVHGVPRHTLANQKRRLDRDPGVYTLSYESLPVVKRDLLPEKV